MKHKKLKIFAIIILIILVSLMFVGNCKKAKALSYQYVSIYGDSTNNAFCYMFNLPLNYQTPGYNSHFAVGMAPSNSANNYGNLFRIYIGEGTFKVISTIDMYYQTPYTNINYNVLYTFDYLTEYNNNKFFVDYYPNNSTTLVTNLILVVEYVYGVPYTSSGNKMMFRFSIITYDASTNTFLPVAYTGNDTSILNLPLTYISTLSSPPSVSRTTFTMSSWDYADTTRCPSYDFLYCTSDYTYSFNGTITLTNGKYTDYSGLFTYLRDNRLYVSFYEWGVRAIGGDYYQEGYNVGYNAGYESGIELGYDEGYDVGYESGYDEGYESGLSGETLFSPAFRIISDIFGAIGAIMAVELVPHVPLGLFILVPLFFSVLGLILWIWRRN